MNSLHLLTVQIIESDFDKIPMFTIYGIVMAISILLFVSWRKKYKALPDKTTVARLIKKSDYDSEYNDPDVRSRAAYSIGKYEFEMNGKRHTTKYRFYDTVPNTIVLYYKKGKWDIRTRKEFSLPQSVAHAAIAYFVVGVAVVSVLIYNAIFGGLL